MRSFRCLVVFAALTAVCLQGSALAQVGGFPARGLRVVVPFPAGGPVDILGRTLGQRLSEAWGQPVIVDNRAGAGGGIGAEYVAKSPADGYTLLLSIAGTITIQPHLVARKTFDPVRDLAPVSQLVTLPFALVANPSVPARSVRDVIALAKAQPGGLNFATSGVGTDYHLATELFKSLAHIDIAAVPYKGGAPSLTAVISGEADLSFQVISTALPYIETRKLKALAVTGARRPAALPGVPTMAEAGVTGYESNGWWGVFAPAGTPREIVDRLHAELSRQMQSRELKERMQKDGFEVVATGPDQFATTIRSESTRWARIVQQANLKPE